MPKDTKTKTAKTTRSKKSSALLTSEAIDAVAAVKKQTADAYEAASADRVARLAERSAIRDETEELKLRKLRADVAILECKATNENIALQRRRDLLCYKDAAVDQFSAVIKIVHDAIERLPHTLRDRCHLDAVQTEKAAKVIEELLVELSKVKVELKSADEVDAMATGAHRSKREVRAYASRD